MSYIPSRKFFDVGTNSMVVSERVTNIIMLLSSCTCSRAHLVLLSITFCALISSLYQFI